MLNFIILQDSWNEEDDRELYDYLDSKDIKYQLMSANEISNLFINETINVEVIFCDTKIMKDYIIKNHLWLNIRKYPEFFNSVYNRKIKKLTLTEVKNKSFPYFVKPIDNDKDFGGMVVTNMLEKIYFKSCVIDKLDNYQLYFSAIVKFVNEFRLFILDNKIYGITDCSKYLINPEDIITQSPPEYILKEIIELNRYRDCVIDIGRLDNSIWSVVEVNPPYSLTSYDYPVEQYYNYCKLVFKNLHQLIWYTYVNF